MTSAVLEDVASLALVAVVVPMLTTTGHEVDVNLIFLILGKAIVFFLLVTVLGALIFPRVPARWGRALPWLDRIGIGPLLRWDSGAHATLQVLLLALAVALLGESMGFHPAVGAYLAGLILRKEYFRSDEEAGYLPGSFGDTKRIVDSVAFSWIGPVFFVHLGTEIVLEPRIVLAVAPYVLVLTFAIATSQVLSAWLAARYTGGMDKNSSLLVGIGMLGRAELAFVVMDIAYVQHSILSEEAFYTLMGTCLLLNISVPILIHWWKKNCLAPSKTPAQ